MVPEKAIWEILAEDSFHILPVRAGEIKTAFAKPSEGPFAAALPPNVDIQDYISYFENMGDNFLRRARSYQRRKISPPDTKT